MKIGIVSRGIPSENHNIGIFEYDQALALKKIGVDVTYFVIDMRSLRRRRKFGIWSYVKDGIPIYVVSIPLGAINYKIFNYIGRKAFVKLYNYYLKSNKEIDVFHAHFSEIGAIVQPIANKNKIEYVFTEHSSLVNKEILSDKNKDLLKRAVAPNRTITVSRRLREMVYKHTGVYADVIPNIIDTELFRANDKLRIRKDTTQYILCTVARLEENKGLDILLRAFALFVKNINKKAHLIICGIGSKKEELQSLCSKLQINNNVDFKGFCDRNSLCEIYNVADCFVLTSYSETFGVSYLEAMSSGTPVIASRCGGPEDFVNEKNGIMVEVGDIEGTYEAIVYMYQNIKSFNSIQLHSFVEENFSQLVVGSRLNDYYHMAIN